MTVVEFEGSAIVRLLLMAYLSRSEKIQDGPGYKIRSSGNSSIKRFHRKYYQTRTFLPHQTLLVNSASHHRLVHPLGGQPLRFLRCSVHLGAPLFNMIRRYNLIPRPDAPDSDITSELMMSSAFYMEVLTESLCRHSSAFDDSSITHPRYST